MWWNFEYVFSTCNDINGGSMEMHNMVMLTF